MSRERFRPFFKDEKYCGEMGKKDARVTVVVVDVVRDPTNQPSSLQLS